MGYKESLLHAVNRYCEATGRTRGGVALAILNDNKFFDNIEDGRTCTMDTYEKVMDWFKANTPKKKRTNTHD